MNARSAALLQHFNERQSQLLSFIRQLCEIESPSYDVDASKQIVAFLENEAQKISFVDSIEKIAAENCGEHLIIRAFNNQSDDKPILLLGHTDTVYPRGTLAQRPFKIEGNQVFAPGIFDMKSGVALMFAALEAFSELNLKPKRPLVILLSCDEEIGSETGRELVEREARNAAVCLVCEPSANGAVKTGRKGTSYYELKAHGISSHAGLDPEKGASAILELSKQILEIDKLQNFARGTTVNVTTINGGTTSNVIPAEAVCEIDVRFTAMDEAARIETAIRSLRPFNERIKLEINGGINRPPLERSEKVIALYEQACQIAANFDYELGETQVGGASDGNFVAALGVPVLDGLGVTGDGAHAAHEHILLSDVPKRAALLAQLLLAL